MNHKDIRDALSSINGAALRGNDIEATYLERMLHTRLMMARAPEDMKELARRSYTIDFLRLAPRVRERGEQRL